MADIHFRVNDELHRLIKITAAHRGESVKEAGERLFWWYVDGTDDLVLDAIENALAYAKAEWDAVGNHPASSYGEDVEFYDSTLRRLKMRMKQGGGEEKPNE